MLSSTRIRKENIYLLQQICSVFTKMGLIWQMELQWMFQFCWEMFSVHQGSPGAEWKFSEGKRRKVSILPARNIVRPSGAPSAKSPRLSVTRPLTIASPAPALSAAWPGAPHGLPSSTPMSSYPQVRFPTSTSTSSSKWVGEPDYISSNPNIPSSSHSSSTWPACMEVCTCQHMTKCLEKEKTEMSINYLVTCHGSVFCFLKLSSGNSCASTNENWPKYW